MRAWEALSGRATADCGQKGEAPQGNEYPERAPRVKSRGAGAALACLDCGRYGEGGDQDVDAGHAASRRKWGRHCCRPHSHRRVGSEERFTPGVSLQPEGRRLCRPALAPVPVPSGAGYDPKTFPSPHGGSATDPVGQASHGSDDAGHRRSIEAGRQVRPADCAPSRFQRSGSCGVRRRPGFHPSTVRHFAVASRVVPKSLLFSGCYPVHPKSQSPLSMSGECAPGPSRARANRPTYPLSAIMPVDKGG